MSFQKRLASGEFLVLAEMNTPKGVDISQLITNARRIKGRVDAVVVPGQVGAQEVDRRGLPAVVAVERAVVHEHALRPAVPRARPAARGVLRSAPLYDSMPRRDPLVRLRHGVRSGTPPAAQDREPDLESAHLQDQVVGVIV